jgi:hypothetical protein
MISRIRSGLLRPATLISIPLWPLVESEISPVSASRCQNVFVISMSRTSCALTSVSFVDNQPVRKSTRSPLICSRVFFSEIFQMIKAMIPMTTGTRRHQSRNHPGLVPYRVGASSKRSFSSLLMGRNCMGSATRQDAFSESIFLVVNSPTLSQLPRRLSEFSTYEKLLSFAVLFRCEGNHDNSLALLTHAAGQESLYFR